LSKEELGIAPNIGAHRSLAVDGNAVFRWIAQFDESTVRQEDFVHFLQSAESYILNFGSAAGREDSGDSDFDTDDSYEDEFEFDEFDDDF
jgi:hypothetical protein